MKPSEEMKITVIEDGPYLVEGGVPLSKETIVIDQDGEACAWRQDAKIEGGNRVMLCRCGKSSTMPFCDGSHFLAEFDGTETASRASYAERATVTEGPVVNLASVDDLCVVARFCHRSGAVWNLVHEDNPIAAETIIEECALCPAGRFTAVDKETGEYIEPELSPSIAFVEDPQKDASGPIWVRGGIPIESADGEEYEIRNRVTLCRCGKSNNKPFCDGAHYPCEFHDGM